MKKQTQSLYWYLLTMYDMRKCENTRRDHIITVVAAKTNTTEKNANTLVKRAMRNNACFQEAARQVCNEIFIH